MNYQPIGLERFVRFDQSDVRMHQRHFKYMPSWTTIYIRLLQVGDYQSADLVRDLNERESDVQLRSVRDLQVEIVKMIEKAA